VVDAGKRQDAGIKGYFLKKVPLGKAQHQRLNVGRRMCAGQSPLCPSRGHHPRRKTPKEFEDQEQHQSPVASTKSIAAYLTHVVLIKKIRGRVRFFGAWDDPHTALQTCLRQAPDLHAGREAHPPTLSADSVTVKQVVNHFAASGASSREPGSMSLCFVI
jgi:hypothetical protein